MMRDGSDGNLDVASEAPVAYSQPRVHGLLANPLRHDIVMKTSARPWTASELSAATGKTLKHVSKALEDLKKAGLVELVDQKPGPKGGIVRFYRAARFMVDAEEWEYLSMPEQASSTAKIVAELQRDQARALEGGTYYSHPHHVLIRDHRQMDDEGIRSTDKILCRAYDELIEVERESLERCGQSGEKSKEVVLGLTAFLA